MQIALAASLMAGLAMSWIGVFILVKRISFSGLSVSQLAALGTVIGVSLGLHYVNFGLALACVGVGMFLASQMAKTGRTPEEAGVACLYILGAGLSILILSKAPRGESDTLNIFFGNVLSLQIGEVLESLAILVLTTLILGIWFYRWVWIAFDPLGAEVAKIKVRNWNFVFFSLFALTMTVCIHIFGVLLAFSYLLLPAAVALLIGNRLKSQFIVITLLTVLATVLGFYFSFRLDFPTGPFIASSLAAAVIAAGIYRRWVAPS